MKRLILTFLLSLTFSTMTLAEVSPECVDYGENFAKVGYGKIPRECIQSSFNSAYTNAYKEYTDKDIIVYGHKNFIFAHLGERSGLQNLVDNNRLPTQISISGDRANIQEVIAVDVDFKHNMIVALVIDKKKGQRAIFSYRLYMGGNLDPMRMIYGEELQTTTSLKVDSINGKIYAISENEGITNVYNLQGNILGHRKEQKTNVKESINSKDFSANTITDVAFSNDGKYVFFLDGKDNKIYTFDSRIRQKSVPKSVKQLPSDIALNQLEYDSDSRSILAKTPEGRILRLDGTFNERMPASVSPTQESK